MGIHGQLHGNYMFKIKHAPPAPEATAEELPYLSFWSYKMKLNRELSLLCRLEVKHCVLDYSFGC